MGVKCPPRQVHSRKERKIFNAFLEKYPHPSPLEFDQLAVIYRDQTDCKEIFPKLPSMLKVYYHQWMETRIIIAKQEAIKDGYNNLLKQLAIPSTSTMNVLSVINDDLLVDKDELHELLVDASNPAYLANQEWHPATKLHVPPIAAPLQREYISFSTTTPTVRRSPQCYFWPFCQKTVAKCGGRFQDKCSEVNSGRIDRPDPAALATAKINARNQEKKNRKQALRAQSSS